MPPAVRPPKPRRSPQSSSSCAAFGAIGSPEGDPDVWSVSSADEDQDNYTVTDEHQDNDDTFRPVKGAGRNRSLGVPVAGNACVINENSENDDRYPDVKPFGATMTEQNFKEQMLEYCDGWDPTYSLPTPKFWNGNTNDLRPCTRVLWRGVPPGKRDGESRNVVFYPAVVQG